MAESEELGAGKRGGDFTATRTQNSARGCRSYELLQRLHEEVSTGDALLAGPLSGPYTQL